MSARHPIISVTGSSGAGTTSVRNTFEQIFRREDVRAVFIEGDGFHAFDRDTMRAMMAREPTLSHFAPRANLLPELEAVFRSYAESGTGRTRHYAHDAHDAQAYGIRRAAFPSGRRSRRIPICCSTRGCMAAWPTRMSTSPATPT